MNIARRTRKSKAKRQKPKVKTRRKGIEGYRVAEPPMHCRTGAIKANADGRRCGPEPGTPIGVYRRLRPEPEGTADERR